MSKNISGLSLTFLGTRGEINVRSRAHQRHSSLLVRYRNTRLMIDCGADWLNRVRIVRPDAIILTHAHPDHALGLAHGAPCPVYATRQTWKVLPAYPIRERRSMPLRKPITIDGIKLQAFSVEHSMRAPAVGYRVSAGGTKFFYVPDVISIRNRSQALRGIALYIGDGATIVRPLIRKRGRILIGHASIRTQLGWCRKERVATAIFTHCGTPIVTGSARKLDRIIRDLGIENGVTASIAHDGRKLRITRTMSRV